MKTIWASKTDYKWAAAKRAELQQKTGLKWDYFSSGRGMVFNPIVTKKTPMDDELADMLLPHIGYDRFMGLNFVRLHEQSGMPLRDVLIAAKTLVKDGRCTPLVNRCGHFSAIKRSRIGLNL